MGTLRPGGTYIYEHANGITYAREIGSHPSTRRAIGWDYRRSDGELDLEDHRLWNDIRREYKKNTSPALRKAVENVIMVYRLTKDDPK
jgi:hypothetical protein